MKEIKIKTVGALLVGAILLLSMIPMGETQKVFHTPEELEAFRQHYWHQSPIDSSFIFPTANNCVGCHGYDVRQNASVNYEGEDINVHDDWSTTMMANSAKDPFWRAKVSHEMLVNPSHSLDLQTKCTSCHAPQGHFTAILRGAQHYTMQEMLADTTALDGVSCGTCHKISEENLGRQFSGEISFDTSRVSFGPYELPFAAPMRDFVGIEPVYSEHINDAGICASCHTLITNSVDLDGNYTGDQFVEQATYHEWLNSVYDDEGSNPITCQGCHMPRIEDEVVISANYLFLNGRSPFGLHSLVGGNSTMIKLMKENKEALGIQAADEHFDETIAKTLQMLKVQTLDLELSLDQLTSDTVFFSVDLLNKAGHKFPSGYPSRRAFIEFVVTASSGDTLFQSGVLQSDYEVAGHIDATEPHYNVINQEDQVQIYELVLGDVEGQFTTVLERSHQALKDNRLPPVGFTQSHSAYDTTRIYGQALSDPDFNFENGIEGSGSDRVQYHFPLNGYNGLLNVSAKVYYQALPPRWMAPLFAESTPEIETFREMYDNADLSPVLIAQQRLDSLLVQSTSTTQVGADLQVQVFPNPLQATRTLQIDASDLEVLGVELYDLNGRLLLERRGNVRQLELPEEGSVYVLKVLTERGEVVKKVMR